MGYFIKMDEFEKDYFDKLKQITPIYQTKRKELALSRIRMFAAALCRQLIEKKEKFDLLVAAGNSGLFMNEITKLTYEHLNLDLPQSICFPLLRFSDSDNTVIYDNTVLKHLIKGKISNIPINPNILFIDDEIMRGLTIKASLDLILNERPDLNSLRTVIIAENHFFEWHYNIPKVSINFFPYSRLIQGLNGNIGQFIPDDLFSEMKSQLPEIRSYNHAMSIIFGGALKRKNEKGISFFDFNVESDLKKNIPDYYKKKTSLHVHLNNLVLESIEKYKQGKIYFRF